MIGGVTTYTMPHLIRIPHMDEKNTYDEYDSGYKKYLQIFVGFGFYYISQVLPNDTSYIRKASATFYLPKGKE